MFGEHLTGIYEKAFDPRTSWEIKLKKAKALGFDFLEISIDESDERLARLEWTREEKEALRRELFEANVSMQSMCLSAHRRFPFGSANPAVRARAYDVMEKAIDFASALGIHVIQLAGYDVYYEDSTTQSVRLFRQGMAWSAQKAAQKQVMLAMEIMDTPFMNSISKHMAYESMIHSPWYKAYPDIGNLSAWPENDVDFELKQGISSIVGVHLKDTLPPSSNFAGQFKCVPFGAGCVNFARRFTQLQTLGYTGPYMIEMWYQEGTDDSAEISKAAAWLQGQYNKGMEEVSGMP